MPSNLLQVRRARCILILAKAPPGLPPAEANRIFNEFIGSQTLPLTIFHDHFIAEVEASPLSSLRAMRSDRLS